MTNRRYKLWVNGLWHDCTDTREVLSPSTGQPVAQMGQADERLLELTIASAQFTFARTRNLSRYLRSRLLQTLAQKIGDRKDEFVERMISEAGKPRSLSEAEVMRAITTFTIAAEEAKRFSGELIPLDIEASGRAFNTAHALWIPLGPVLAITPFNFPLNLIAHKVAPSLAVGAPVILKPPHQAPGCAILLAELFEQTAKEISDNEEQIPLSFLQVVGSSNEKIEKLVVDPRISILSFTGSDTVGWALQQKAIRKKVALELGGNSATIIHSDADIKRAAERCAFGGFAYAGQICISVQRIIIHKSVSALFEKLFLDEVKKIKVGDPDHKGTLVGPLIDDKAAQRLTSWLKEATDDGAKLLMGGSIEGRIMTPTVISGAKPNHKIYSEEAFGPVVTLETYDQFEEALSIVNRSRFGLQAGLFTDSQSCVQKAIQFLDIGGLIINEIPTYRADNMPYGGTKESGMGREGVIYSMKDYCELKTVVSWKTDSDAH